MEEKTDFFVKIENPIVFRRTFLEASKNTLDSLNNYEEFREIRTKKIELTLLLTDIINDITMLLDRLKKDLPATSIRSGKQQSTQQSKKTRPKKQKPSVMSVPKKTSKASLKSDLEKVEKKLNSLR